MDSIINALKVTENRWLQLDNYERRYKPFNDNLAIRRLFI